MRLNPAQKNKAEERGAITQANATTGHTLKELFGV
jgi:hypothetical protein